VIGSLIKNFFTLAGAESFSKVIVFATFAYLARVLGPSAFGLIEWSAAVLMCASMVVEQGLSSYGAREIAKEPHATGGLVAHIVRIRFVLAGLSYLAIVAFALAAVRDAIVFRLVLVYGLSVWLMPLSLVWVFQGHSRMNFVAVLQVLRFTLFAAVVLLLVREADDLPVVAWAEVISVGTAALTSLWLYRRYIAGPSVAGQDAMRVWDILRQAIPIGLSQIFWVAKYFGAVLVIGLIARPDETGYFAASMRILIAVHAFVWLYYFNLLPSMTKSWNESPTKFAGLVRWSMQIVLPSCFVIGLVWLAGARIAMTAAFGGDFAAGAATLQWLCGVFIAASISGHFRFGLIAAGRQREEMIASAIGATLALTLVPAGYFLTGTAGAAAALCAAEIAVLVITWAISRRLLFRVKEANFQFPEELLDNARGAVR
jgi:PST family polysaccharide transporter